MPGSSDTGAEARHLVLELAPEGAEVHSGKGKTIDDLRLFAELIESGRYDAIRPKLQKMDRSTHGREMRKLGAAPDFQLGSVAAVTEDGALVGASATGNNLATYADGAGKVIFLVGSQKIVKDLPAALDRIRETVFRARTSGCGSGWASTASSPRCWSPAHRPDDPTAAPVGV